jgi:2-C-methyl-D-erythritol 2,4-cyclodiphosphate synthase
MVLGQEQKGEQTGQGIRLPYRVGQGFDVHAFGAATPQSSITLGGVVIESDRPLLAHSDGDVLLHALCDALFGAVGLGDIGQHFPDTDPAFADADSRQLLAQVYQQVESKGYQLGNADLTIVAQSPKMSPHRAAMQSSIASVLGVAVDVINVKATTTERLGFCGRAEGIACMASVLLLAK